MPTDYVGVGNNALVPAASGLVTFCLQEPRLNHHYHHHHHHHLGHVSDVAVSTSDCRDDRSAHVSMRKPGRCRATRRLSRRYVNLVRPGLLFQSFGRPNNDDSYYSTGPGRSRLCIHNQRSGDVELVLHPIAVVAEFSDESPSWWHAQTNGCYTYMVVQKTGPSYFIANILKTPWPNCVEIDELLQYYMVNTVINFLFKNFIALWRHLAKTQLLSFIHTVQIDFSITQ